jgi:hypothetical protein
MKQNGIEPISLRRSNTFRISNQRAQQDTELGPRLLSANTCFHHYLIYQLQLITPLQINYDYDVTQRPCSIVTLKQATYSQSKGRC